MNQTETQIATGITIEGLPGYNSTGYAFAWRGQWWAEFSDGNHCLHWGVSFDWVERHAVQRQIALSQTQDRKIATREELLINADLMQETLTRFKLYVKAADAFKEASYDGDAMDQLSCLTATIERCQEYLLGETK